MRVSSVSTGIGSFGVVFEVEDVQSQPPVRYAMKVQPGGSDFQRELKFMNQMNSMHVVKIAKGILFLEHIFLHC